MPRKPDPHFLAITAHDLRGAVGVLDGAMKELTREFPSANVDQAKLTVMMGRSTQKLLLLGDRLTVLAKLMGGIELDLSEMVDLTSLVREASNRAFAAYARRGLRLHVDGAPLSLRVHAQSLAGAVAELTALFCSFTQAELVIRVIGDAAMARVTFESDNPSEGVEHAIRDRSGTTQASAGIAFAEAVLDGHHGTLDLSGGDGANAGLHLLIPR